MGRTLKTAPSPRAGSLLLLCAIACTDSGQSPSPAVIHVTAVKLTPQSIQLTGVGDTIRLKVQITPTNATDMAISWESTDSGVAVVDPVGLVTAASIGSGVFVTVFTHDGGHQASVNVTVIP
jgi:uncharacterized protein YjdB